jgi:transposase InsO family protein
MKFAFIQQQAGLFPVNVCCQVLAVSRAGFYAWRDRPVSPQAQRREDLAARIQAVYQENRRVYGSPRIYHVLRAQGQSVCENTVAKLMRADQIRARPPRRFVPCTTDSDHGQPVAPNLLDRQFTAAQPNQKWVVDITYIPTGEGWLYLAGVLDLYSRRLVGWSMAEHMRTELVQDALAMALGRRAPAAGLLHHSDQGSQYASEDYQHLLEIRQITVSMSGKGDCWDNACMESFWGTLKGELLSQQHFATRQQARALIFEYLEVFYNRQRLHSSLGYQSPEAFEATRG